MTCYISPRSHINKTLFHPISLFIKSHSPFNQFLTTKRIFLVFEKNKFIKNLFNIFHKIAIFIFTRNIRKNIINNSLTFFNNT